MPLFANDEYHISFNGPDPYYNNIPLRGRHQAPALQSTTKTKKTILQKLKMRKPNATNSMPTPPVSDGTGPSQKDNMQQQSATENDVNAVTPPNVRQR